MLGRSWQSSKDRVVVTDGDAAALHVLVADAKDGYAWRTAASLSEPGANADQWIGQSCVTGSGRYAVVVYAPRTMVNTEDGFHAGGLAAIVDLDTGKVTKLDAHVSLAYHDPGCGTGDTAVLTSADERGRAYVTKMIMVDAPAGRVARTVSVTGQVTSAVPYGVSRIAAVRGDVLTSFDAFGRERTLVARTGADALLRLVPDRSGGLGYESVTADRVRIHRFAGRDAVVAAGRIGDLQVQGSGGRVFVTGRTARLPTPHVPAGWAAVDSPVDAQISTMGQLVVTSANNRTEAAGRANLVQDPPRGVQRVHVAATVPATGASVAFTVAPSPRRPGDGARPSPALGASDALRNLRRPASASDDNSTTTVDLDRICAVPRNDPTILSFQESAKQAEWAADLAVQGRLDITRPAHWNGSTLPAYSPQALFPDTHPVRVPAQILLGVMAQESNMWQASPHAVDGENGNFEQGGFYGSPGDPTQVNWAKADCGYGATQVTTGMRRSDGTSVYSAVQQTALTIDYAANIVAGLRILESKWNELHGYGLTVNGGDPKYLESWWLALWAYNSGYHAPGSDTSGMYGLGWTNNPDNEDYPADRQRFLEGSPDDAKTPNHWSYPERVLGYAEYSLVRYDYVNKDYDTTFTPANWASGHTVELPQFRYAFCVPAKNQCDPQRIHKPGDYPTDPGGNCQRDDLKCWWHDSASWLNCPTQCGQEVLTYAAGSGDPGAPTIYPSDCSLTKLPSGSLIIDDVPSSTFSACSKTWTNSGSLTFSFPRVANGTYPAKSDLHQIGAGFGGHFWFAHTWSTPPDDPTDDYSRMELSGTWKLNKALTGWARVLVYVPDHGAQSHDAEYTVNTGTVVERRSVVEDDEVGSWRSLGVFQFDGTPTVSLSNGTGNQLAGTQEGVQDIAWDAVAFEPLSRKPANFVVSLGDSYASGEGATPGDDFVPGQGPDDGRDYYNESAHDGADPLLRDACHRSTQSWSRQAHLPGNADTVGHRADTWDNDLDYHFAACSGARTNNLLPYQLPDGSVPKNAFGLGATTDYGEPPQLAQGYLDANTTLVTFSIGGNDARFTDVLNFCKLSTDHCEDKTLPGDSAPLGTAEPALIEGKVHDSIVTVLKSIRQLAPNAKIVLMGYPQIFTTADEDNPAGSCLPINGYDRNWLNLLALQLNAVMEDTISDSQVGNAVFADPAPAFVGHAECTDDAYIRGIEVPDPVRGDSPDALIASDTGHPNLSGAAALAQVLTQALSQ